MKSARRDAGAAYLAGLENLAGPTAHGSSNLPPSAFAPVAKLDKALASGAKKCRFKSG